MPGCVITLPKTVSPKTASERLDLSFGIFARRGEKYSCCKLKQQGSLKPKIRFSGCLWRLVLRQSVFVSQKRANRFSDGLMFTFGFKNA